MVLLIRPRTAPTALPCCAAAARYWTKVWTDAGIDGYQNVLQVQVAEREVSDIHQLSALLTELEEDPRQCIVRGGFVGRDTSDRMLPRLLEADRNAGKEAREPKPGFTLRRGVLFPDRPLHMLMIDIDKFQPTLGDPVADPEMAIDEFIAMQLPAAFHDITYHWQLSCSAGSSGNERVLKAHVWFWLAVPRSSAEMYAWAEATPGVDKSLMHIVQVHYTAAPIFHDGIADPVPRRSGLRRGANGDEVHLSLDASILRAAQVKRSSRRDLVDPRSKPGVIGALCRAFEPWQVVDLFPELFAAGATRARASRGCSAAVPRKA